MDRQTAMPHTVREQHIYGTGELTLNLLRHALRIREPNRGKQHADSLLAHNLRDPCAVQQTGTNQNECQGCRTRPGLPASGEWWGLTLVALLDTR